jgi:hypothetical protein
MRTEHGRFAGILDKGRAEGKNKLRRALRVAGYLIGKPETHAPALGRLDTLEDNRNMDDILLR